MQSTWGGACAEPTTEGEQLLDPFHVYGRVKRIRSKPVQSFTGSDTFLRIAQAEKEHLIEVNIGVSSISDDSASRGREVVGQVHVHDWQFARRILYVWLLWEDSNLEIRLCTTPHNVTCMCAVPFH